MKRLPPSGYVSSEDSQKPGYLAKRFAQKRRELSQQADERRVADELQASILREKVSRLADRRATK